MTAPRPGRLGYPEGEPTVFAADEQAAHAVPVAHLATLAEAVLRDEGVRGGCELSLLFVDEATIADLNQRYLGGEGPTDVLAFPLDDEPSAGGRDPDAGTSGPDRTPPEHDEIPVLLGDVIVCPAVAARNAPDHAGTYDDELALLVVHGVLHVLGMDHADAEEEAAMQARERELLERHHRSSASGGSDGEAPDGGGRGK